MRRLREKDTRVDLYYNDVFACTILLDKLSSPPKKKPEYFDQISS